MSEFDQLAAVTESNSVDNGFEKLDALSTPEAESAEDFVSSSTQRQEVDDEEEEAISPVSEEDISPLVDLGFEAPVSRAQEPEPSPDTTEEELPQPIPPTPTPVPAAQITLPTKKSSPAPSGLYHILD